MNTNGHIQHLKSEIALHEAILKGLKEALDIALLEAFAQEHGLREGDTILVTDELLKACGESWVRNEIKVQTHCHIKSISPSNGRMFIGPGAEYSSTGAAYGMFHTDEIKPCREAYLKSVSNGA